ncbi:MAG: response regulator [Pseudomonadota bacterium]
MAHILVLEDDVELAFALTDLLAGQGHEVSWARGAAEAFGVLRQHSIDLVLSDIYIYQNDEIVTDGGISLIGAMRSPILADGSTLRSIPIIAMSGAVKYQGQKAILNVARSLGAHEVLAKPFSDEQLLAVVEKLLSSDFDAERG